MKSTLTFVLFLLFSTYFVQSQTQKKKDKANNYLELAHKEKQGKNYIQARKYYLLAVKNNRKLANQCYTAIGNMYLASGSICGGSNPLEKRAYAIAAYNMYVKAGNTEKQKHAQKYYPTKEMIFQYPDSQGKAYTLPCWIGETVILPKL